ncbi:helix-turn-helix transcriptional regulator [Paenibacillus nasutitermitis]|uniref:DNA-binding transcriptional regulator n=1 Tax=Paenibacillus nasutitermitis TaxID=1652958 RepID=A0A916Z742_9BACL|nr:YafY family protein [Paenibacillus nasutitermitis]GGD79256.1 DNA-binding transcriptional regulator [Paenibacillus nasutitermitis]
MSKTKLLFNLMMYVNAKRAFTAQDVAYEFDISVRTAHRYLTELSEIGVPLYTEHGRNGGYRVLNNRILPPIIFDENEAFSIFFAFQSLKFYQSLPFDIEMKSVSVKLYSSLPNDVKRKIDRLEAVLSFWNIKRSVPSRYLKEIIDAAAEKQILQIEYISKANNTIRDVSPIGIYAYDGFWYMPALDLANDEVKLFRTDRIVSLKTMDKEHDQQVTISEWLNSHTAQIPSDPIRLFVELTREGLRQCRSQPWLEPESVVGDEDQAYIDTVIDKSEVEFVAKYFLQLGTSAKVIEPREIVDRIRALSQELLLQYSDM